MKRTTISLAVAGAIAAPSAVQAVKYKLSGQVNRAVVYYDDGADSAVRNVDVDSTGTRFRLRGSEDLGNGMRVGFRWEFQTSSNGSSRNRPGPETTVQGAGNGDNTRNLNDGGNLRVANVFFASRWGKLSIGQGSGAGDGAAEVDLSGTTDVLYSNRSTFTGGMLWRTSGGAPLSTTNTTTNANQVVSVNGVPTNFVATTTTTSNLTSADTYNNFDGFSRYDQVRYDSPSLGPAIISASIGNDNRWEMAGRLNTQLAGGELRAALFYGEDHGRSALNNERYGGSASYLFSQGTNITLAYTRQDQDASGGTDSDAYTVKLGHKWGPNAVAAQYSVGDDVTRGYTDTSFGLAYKHSLRRANTNLFAGWYYDQLDTPTGIASVEDHNTVIMGAKVKFD